MNCRRARHLLFDFFDGLSNEALRAEVDRHVGECADCERYASEMARSLALLRHAPVEPLDENFNWKVRLAIHREKNAALARAQSTGAWVRAWNFRYAISGSLAFGAVLVVGAVLLRDGNVSVPGSSREPVEITEATSAPERVVSPRSNVSTRNNDAVHQVSTGQFGPNPNTGRAQGAIDVSEADCRIDSIMQVDMMRMSPRDRERYIQLQMERLHQHQSQQQAAVPQP